MGARRILGLVLAGAFAEAGVPPPMLEAEERAYVASLVLGDGTREPDALARAADVQLIQARLTGCGGEVTDGRVIIYSRHRDPAVVGLRIMHGIAHCLLFREYPWEHTEADVWLLTGLLLPPAQTLRVWGGRTKIDMGLHAEA